MKYLQKAVASVLAVALAAGLASCSVILIDPKDTQTAAGTVAVSGYAGGEAAGGGTSASAAPDSLPGRGRGAGFPPTAPPDCACCWTIPARRARTGQTA